MEEEGGNEEAVWAPMFFSSHCIRPHPSFAVFLVFGRKTTKKLT
jgi:hypothetical protein